jgi:hypothetical protein
MIFICVCGASNGDSELSLESKTRTSWHETVPEVKENTYYNLYIKFKAVKQRKNEYKFCLVIDDADATMIL